MGAGVPAVVVAAAEGSGSGLGSGVTAGAAVISGVGVETATADGAGGEADLKTPKKSKPRRSSSRMKTNQVVLWSDVSVDSPIASKLS